MSIYKRKSGRYAVLVDLGSVLNWRRRRRALGTYRTREEAEKAERDALQARDQGIDLSSRHGHCARIAEAICSKP